MKVLITGARAPVALELARRLHRAGAEVHLADSLALPGARFSRSVAAYHVLPPPAVDPPAFGRALAALVRRERVELVLPTSEEIFYVARYRALVDAAVFVDDFAALLALHDKVRFATETRPLGGVRMPATVPVDEAFQPSARELRELVLKPVFSRFATHALVGSQHVRARPYPAWLAPLPRPDAHPRRGVLHLLRGA